MPFMEWSDACSVGVAEIDDDHKKLVALINELDDAVVTGRGHDVMGKILDGLISYVSYHFRHEEGLFLRAQYPDYAAHKNQHEHLTAQVMEIQARFKSDPTALLPTEVLDFLKSWLYNHILGSDRKFGVYLNASDKEMM